MTRDTQLNETFAALAHPARRAMLARLARGDATVSELAKPLDMSLPAVSRHIRALEKAGLISQQVEAQFRRCSLKPEALTVAVSWADEQRALWQARFDKIDALIQFDKEDSHE